MSSKDGPPGLPPFLSKFSRPAVIAIAVIAGLNLFALYVIFNRPTTSQQNEVASLPRIAEAVAAGEVKELAVHGDLLIANTSRGYSLSAYKEPSLSAFETLAFLGVPEEALEALPITVEKPQAQNSNMGWLFYVLILGGLIAFFVYRHRKTEGGGAGGNLGQLGRSQPRVVSGGKGSGARVEHPQVTFDDVAGVESAKFELQEIVEFLKDPDKFARLGARVPKGVLMVGPPGTGKTLMAKAVAGEAGVPFFSISGSEFVEIYVGVGASRVRDLFQRARNEAPSIIFVDEIDAVGRRRGAHAGSTNDEREQTLNQVLVEMDGFSSTTRVIVIAATNRVDILDPALLRPGRFDRKVVVDRPDLEGRQAILKVHVRGKPLAPDISVGDLARLTPGFVGADLENLVNEAAILAARRDLTAIGQQEFQDAMERIVAGPERKGNLLSVHERRVIAFHEAGHAVVMHHLENSDPVHKVSIVSRGMALGYTMPLPENDKYLRTREAFEDEIVGLLGGRAAEEIIFARVTTGAANDLGRATKLARAMITRYGFSPELGLRTYGDESENTYFMEMRDYSDEMAHAIDREINQILNTAYRRAREIIMEQRLTLERLAEALLDRETIDRAEFERLMGPVQAESS